MALKSLTQATKEGYELWRSAFNGEWKPCSWEQLNERQQSSLKAVAAYVVAQATGADDHIPN